MEKSTDFFVKQLRADILRTFRFLLCEVAICNFRYARCLLHLAFLAYIVFFAQIAPVLVYRSRSQFEARPAAGSARWPQGPFRITIFRAFLRRSRMDYCVIEILQVCLSKFVMRTRNIFHTNLDQSLKPFFSFNTCITNAKCYFCYTFVWWKRDTPADKIKFHC